MVRQEKDQDKARTREQNTGGRKSSYWVHRKKETGSSRPVLPYFVFVSILSGLAQALSCLELVFVLLFLCITVCVWVVPFLLSFGLCLVSFLPWFDFHENAGSFFGIGRRASIIHHGSVHLKTHQVQRQRQDIRQDKTAIASKFRQNKTKDKDKDKHKTKIRLGKAKQDKAKQDKTRQDTRQNRKRQTNRPSCV